VLVVDDDGEMRDAVAGELVRHGYEVVAARHGADALSLLARLRDTGLPSAIVLDLAMPVMDGYEFLAARAEVPDLAAIPVVIMSAAPPNRDLASSTWNELVPKPCPPAELVEAVSHVVRGRRQRG
jgi:CheY-like chemotaxis protein